MSIEIRSTGDILAALKNHPDWADAVFDALLSSQRRMDRIRQKILTDDLLRLPGEFKRAEEEWREDRRSILEAVRELGEGQSRLAAAQEKTEARVGQLAAAQEKTEARVGQLAAAQEKTEARVGQLAAAQEKTEARVGQLAAAQEKTEARVGQLAAAQEKTEARVGQLAAAQEKTEARVGQLAAAQEKTEARVGQLAAAQEKTEARVGQLAAAQEKTEATFRLFMESTQVFRKSILDVLRNHEGLLIESLVLAKLHNYLHRRISPVEVLEPRLVSRMLDAAQKANAISEDEHDSIAEADALAVGQDKGTGEPVCVAAEVSAKVNVEDVDRAEERSKIFLKAAQAAVRQKPAQWRRIFSAEPSKAFGLVVGRSITDEARGEAERRDVIFAKFRNGPGIEGL
ncbi:hypothetical protein [Methylacidimicrobium sp. B4]|uniref:hypothetical protein n=1 Tax=Methylacidimicrobium sp. B4 TaxID=2796139 RepID=UPI001A8F7F65|nr:hypothetical protein [Methylacidimicrobium sp. B4]QSR85206.1 hypothetical protein MacB4_02785 [Methylacidimicrobium sp. B4]